MKVFVYGTLLKGMSRSHSLNNSSFEGFGVIRGSLYDLGSYPGIIDSKDSVYGGKRLAPSPYRRDTNRHQ